MTTPRRRRGASPNTDDLAGLGDTPDPGGRLRKAPSADPVLGVSGPPHADAATGKKGPARRAKPTSKNKVGFYQDSDDTARARAAYDWTRPREEHRSFSDFIAAALMREVERLEAAYNDGKPWPSLEPGKLPTGKPLK